MNIETGLKLICDQLPIKITEAFSNYGSIVDIVGVNEKVPNVKCSIFVYLCYWELLRNGKKWLTCYFRSRDRCKMILESMIGLKVEALSFNAQEKTFIFKIEKDIMIKLSSDVNYYGESSDLFNFFLPDKTVVCYSPEQEFYLSR